MNNFSIDFNFFLFFILKIILIKEKKTKRTHIMPISEED